MTPRTRGTRLAAVAAALLLAACVGDGDERITRVDLPANGGALFSRYVSLGNSITAGVQSGGLVDTLQLRAYPVLLAQRAGTPFGVPLIARPGCPAPFTAPLVAPVGTAACAFRDTTPGAVPGLVQNLGVPGARIADVIVPSASVTQANLLLVGARSPLQAAVQAQPTFVSLWIGNNDALGAALSGNLAGAGADSALTPLASFQGSLNTIVSTLQGIPTLQGVALIGVVNPVAAVPLLQPGAYFYLARDTAGKFQNRTVNANCSPVNNLGQPNPLAANLVSFQMVTAAGFNEISCDPNFYPVGDPRRGALLLDTQEQAVISARVTAYNAALQAAATANNWVFFNPNTLLNQYLNERTPAGTGAFQRIRRCQLLFTNPPPATEDQFRTALGLSCPVTGATAAPNFFGSIFSFDGVHPSSDAHRLISIQLATAINTRYGTKLTTT